MNIKIFGIDAVTVEDCSIVVVVVECIVDAVLAGAVVAAVILHATLASSFTAGTRIVVTNLLGALVIVAILLFHAAAVAAAVMVIGVAPIARNALLGIARVVPAMNGAAPCTGSQNKGNDDHEYVSAVGEDVPDGQVIILRIVPVGRHEDQRGSQDLETQKEASDEHPNRRPKAVARTEMAILHGFGFSGEIQRCDRHGRHRQDTRVDPQLDRFTPKEIFHNDFARPKN